jgi:hypothetical protein
LSAVAVFRQLETAGNWVRAFTFLTYLIFFSAWIRVQWDFSPTALGCATFHSPRQDCNLKFDLTKLGQDEDPAIGFREPDANDIHLFF